ncbi:hypothetical protein E4T44_01756 [Aureobasidium sp. EXF-8845]|nr:hypothetical protein E4T45_09058 [Aureobasidium sp. EXF-8846]KAI4852034.1 hypothetical protein E4T44_01756 [Aureobasidium sp. EXF-8845]
MAKKAKSRTIAVRLISMALTGYYKTLIRPRQHRPLSMLKYDPVGKFSSSNYTTSCEMERMERMERLVDKRQDAKEREKMEDGRRETLCVKRGGMEG